MKTAKSIIVVLFVLLTAQIASAYYCPSTGRWLSRDPIGEPGFENLQTASSLLRIGNSVLQPSGRWSSRDSINDADFIFHHRSYVLQLDRQHIVADMPYLFISNDAMNNDDILGLCPCNTCNKWRIEIVSVFSAEYGGGVVAVKAQLTADKSCKMDKYHANNYQYVGPTIGGGLKYTGNLGVGSKDFSTKCVPWSDHNGFGRVTGIGGGAVMTYGLTYFTTPLAYFEIHSPSWGVDASLFTSIGWWHMSPVNGPGTEQE
jgi:hypothetical protein